MVGNLSLTQLFRYDDWANTEALTALQSFGSSAPARAVRLLSHVVAAQELWMERIRKNNLPVKVWPEWTLAELKEHMERSAADWRTLLGNAGAEELNRGIAYTNSKGENWESRIEDIATHVAMHGTYHRGQIAVEIRAAGITPPYTDYIEAVRRGKLR